MNISHKMFTLLTLHLTTFLFFEHSSAQTISNMYSPESVQLIRDIESAFCRSKANLTPCNLAEGKVCLNHDCVSACTLKGLSPCLCPAGLSCKLCCKNGSSDDTHEKCVLSKDFGIADRTGDAIFRQSTMESCSKEQSRGILSICEDHENGKICDIYQQKVNNLTTEYAHICIAGRCEPLRCSTLGSYGSCLCKQTVTRSPYCCSALSTQDECIPYQNLLRRLLPVYESFLNLTNGPRDTEINIATTATTISASLHDCADTKDGVPCGIDKVCKDGRCRHVCESPEHACVCSPGSANECQICCLTHDSECRIHNYTNAVNSLAGGSATIDLSGKSMRLFTRPVGTPCNLSLGTCDITGQCKAILNHPIEVSLLNSCRNSSNEGKVCGINHSCQNLECQHACGKAEDECVCSAEAYSECQVCCNRRGSCEPASFSGRSDPDKARVVSLMQLPGTNCNNTANVCDWYGSCVDAKAHPELALCRFSENEGLQCGPHHRCRKQKCAHVCGFDENQCTCPAESSAECHVCCYGNGVCSSIFDGNSKSTHLLQAEGTACNSTFGKCDESGKCTQISISTNISFCEQARNQGKQCGTRHVCKEKKCQHVCGSELAECQCNSSSEVECHTCCVANNGLCTVHHVYEATQQSFMLQPMGTACNGSSGVCNETGNCEVQESFCSQPKREGQRCGSAHICKEGQCTHVCGNKSRECKCTDDECHVCCLQSAASNNRLLTRFQRSISATGTGNNNAVKHEAVVADAICASPRNILKHAFAVLTRPFGYSCNSTAGLCNNNGECIPIDKASNKTNTLKGSAVTTTTIQSNWHIIVPSALSLCITYGPAETLFNWYLSIICVYFLRNQQPQ